MTRLWKLNSLVGSVATVCVVGAYFAGNHHETFVGDSTNVDWKTTSQAILLLKVAVAGYIWQLLMTLVGLLAGFFVAPDRR